MFAIVLRHRLLAWCNLVRELAALEAMGVGRYRLSPQDVDMVAVARTFRGVLDGRLDARAGFAALAVFYRAPVWENLGPLALVALVATLGISAIGTLFAAMTAPTKTRDILLPVLMFPLLAPVLIGAVKATAAILAGGGWEETGDWVKLIGAYDLIFISVAAVMFEYVLEE